MINCWQDRLVNFGISRLKVRPLKVILAAAALSSQIPAPLFTSSISHIPIRNQFLCHRWLSTFSPISSSTDTMTLQIPLQNFSIPWQHHQLYKQRLSIDSPAVPPYDQFPWDCDGDRTTFSSAQLQYPGQITAHNLHEFTVLIRTLYPYWTILPLIFPIGRKLALKR